MKSIAIVLASITALASAQIVLDPKSNTYTCPSGKQAFCAGDSLTTNIIIRCSNTIGTPENCNDNLASISPIGVKDFAPCYETSSLAGDAACSYHGVVYPSSSNGYIFFLPSPSNTTLSELSPPSTSPSSNISLTLAAPTAMPTQTQWVAQAISAALENKAPYPTINPNGTVIGTASGTGVGKATGMPYKGGAGVVECGGWMVRMMGVVGAGVVVLL